MRKIILDSSWIVSAALLAKILALFAQIILGFLLTIESFGNYAVALGLTTFFTWARNGALQQLVIAEVIRGRDPGDHYGLAHLFNMVSAIALTILAYIIWDEGSYAGVIILSFAFWQLFSLPQLRIRTICSVSGNFKQLSYYETGLSLVRNIVLVATAFIFKNEVCFAYSVVAMALYDILIERKYFSIKPGGFWSSVPGKVRSLDILRSSRWLMLGSVGSLMIVQGVFSVVGFMTSEKAAGLFYFAFQLITVFAVLLGEAIKKVLMPSMARIVDVRERLKALDTIVSYSLIVLVPISFMMVPSIKPLLSIIWESKWIDAIFPAQAMAATMFVSIIVMQCYSFLEASGAWKARNIMLLLEGVVYLLTAFLAGITGDLETIVLLTVASRCIAGGLQVAWVYYKYDYPAVLLLKSLFAVCAISLFTAFGAWKFIETTGASDFIKIAFFGVVTLITLLIFLLYKFRVDGISWKKFHSGLD